MDEGMDGGGGVQGTRTCVADAASPTRDPYMRTRGTQFRGYLGQDPREAHQHHSHREIMPSCPAVSTRDSACMTTSHVPVHSSLHDNGQGLQTGGSVPEVLVHQVSVATVYHCHQLGQRIGLHLGGGGV